MFEYVGKPPARSGQIALAGQRPPDEAPAEPREKRAGDAAAPQAFDGERAAADTNEPSCHREFTRAVPPPPIPDAGAGGAMGSKVEVLRSVERLVERLVQCRLVHAVQPCKIPVRRDRRHAADRIPYSVRHRARQRMGFGKRHLARTSEHNGQIRPFFARSEMAFPSAALQAAWYTGCSIIPTP